MAKLPNVTKAANHVIQMMFNSWEYNKLWSPEVWIDLLHTYCHCKICSKLEDSFSAHICTSVSEVDLDVGPISSLKLSVTHEDLQIEWKQHKRQTNH